MTAAHAFKVDENLPASVAVRLREAGIDAVTVLDQKLGGTADSTLYEVCGSEGRVLITLDVGFGDIRTYPPGTGPGVIVLRPRRQDAMSILRLVDSLLESLAREFAGGALWIVDENRIRVR